MTATMQQQLEARGLAPSAPSVDTRYVTSAHLVSSQKRGIDLVGPVLEDQRWQARAGEGFGAAQVVIDWAVQRARCPQGKPSVVWQLTQDSNGQDVVTMRFAAQDCRDCPVRGQCVRSDRERALTIRTQEQHEALQAARQRQRTEAFQEQYAARARAPERSLKSSGACRARACSWASYCAWG